MILRKLYETDIESIFAIEQCTQIAPWTREILNHCLRAGSIGWVIEIDGQVIGFIILSVYGGEGHILNLCIHPDFQHRGFGRALIQHALKMVKENNVHMIFLEVRRSNAPAISLYQSLGFVEIGERKNYYPKLEGREDALIFAKDLEADSAGMADDLTTIR